MGWALIFVLKANIHAVSFADYQSCINAGNQLVMNGTKIKYICVEK